MEATGALGRRGPSNVYELAREAVRARSRVFWIVAGLTLLAAGLRFATLGGQAYHHDEIVTASRILRGSFWHAMDAVGFSESAPPLYYALAWAWTQFTGTGEFGLRSLSAVAGIATVPIAYLLGLQLRGARAGVAAAALVAVNPMLVWYSQEARGYAVLVLLTAIATLLFTRALDRGRRRDVVWWGAASALAVATHYFAIFPIVLQAAWLLRRLGRKALPGLRIAAIAALLLAPLAILQMLQGHAEWIADHSLGHRLWQIWATFAVGETGDVIAQPERLVPAIVPLLGIAGALVLLAVRGERAERRAGGLMLAIVAFIFAAPLAIAVLDPSVDYVLARNLIPALVPLLAAVAIGVTLRDARRIGLLAGTVLFAYSLGFTLLASSSPALQRPDWEAVATRLGQPQAPRAIVSWTLGQASLRWYLSSGSIQVAASEEFPWYVHEVDIISDGPAPPVPTRLLGPGFTEVSYQRAGALRIRRYALPGPDLARLRLRRVDDAETNFRSNSVLVDGIGPG